MNISLFIRYVDAENVAKVNMKWNNKLLKYFGSLSGYKLTTCIIITLLLNHNQHYIAV